MTADLKVFSFVNKDGGKRFNITEFLNIIGLLVSKIYPFCSNILCVVLIF